MEKPLKLKKVLTLYKKSCWNHSGHCELSIRLCSTELREKHLALSVWPVQLQQVRHTCHPVLEMICQDVQSYSLNKNGVSIPRHSSIEGQFGAIWDRGSFVAINPGDREKYDQNLSDHIEAIYILAKEK